MKSNSKDEQLWPREDKADPSKLFEVIEDLAAENTDPRVRHQVETEKKQFAEAMDIIENPPELFLRDLPEACLQGRLGEICRRRLGNFPRAFAWIALLVAASCKLDQQTGARTNLTAASSARYTAESPKRHPVPRDRTTHAHGYLERQR